MWNALVYALVLLKVIQVVVALVHALRLVVGNHAIEVEGYAQFGVDLGSGDARRKHPPGRVVGVDGFLHVFLIGTEEQRGVECRDVLVGRAARHERRAGDVQLIMVDRTKYPQAGFRGVAREQHHLYRQLLGEGLVDTQEAANERERHAFGEWLVQVLLLVMAVRLDALGLVDVVRDREVEQRT